MAVSVALVTTVEAGVDAMHLVIALAVICCQHFLELISLLSGVARIAPGHRSRARGMALLAEGFRRQYNGAIPIARAAIDHRNAAILCMLKRHLSVHIHAVGYSRISEAPSLQSRQHAQTTPPG